MANATQQRAALGEHAGAASVSVAIDDRAVPAPKSSMNPVVRALVLTALSTFAIVASASHTLLAQPFKNGLGIEGLRLPYFHSLLTVVSFPVPLAIWLIVTRGRPQFPSSRRWKAYAILASLDAMNVLLGSFGLNFLSAATYAILRGSSIVFVVGLSKLMTTKQFNIWQYSGVVFMMLAVACMAIVENKPTGSTSVIDEIEFSAKVIGFATSLASSLFVSLLSVCTQKLFADEESKGDFAFVCEVNTIQSLLAFIILLPFALCSQEFANLGDTFRTVQAHGHLTYMVLLSIGISVAGPLQMFGNISVTSLSSATLARSLGGPRRILIIILGYVLFNQKIDNSVVAAAILMTVSLAVYIYGGWVLQKGKIADKLNGPK